MNERLLHNDNENQCRQRGRVVKAACLRSTQSRFKTYSHHSVVSLRKIFYSTFPGLMVWQAVLNFSHISIKLQADSIILASVEKGRDNCLSYIY